MKNCIRESKKYESIDESSRYKYSSKSIFGKVNYFVGVRNENGAVIREKISEDEFKNIECRLVDNR